MNTYILFAKSSFMMSLHPVVERISQIKILIEHLEQVVGGAGKRGAIV